MSKRNFMEKMLEGVVVEWKRLVHLVLLTP